MSDKMELSAGNAPDIKDQTPANKTKPRCDICNKELSGESSMQDHLKGAKHAKAVKAKEVIENLLKEGNDVPVVPGSKSMFRCGTCDIVLNSYQQLELHLNGSRHKAQEQALKEKNMPTGAIELVGATTVNTAKTDDNSQPDANGATKPTKPGDATKAQKPVGKGVQIFECTSCHITLNSKAQQEDHMKSRKHAERASGMRTARGRGFGRGFRRGRGRGYNPVGGNDAPRSGMYPQHHQHQQPQQYQQDQQYQVDQQFQRDQPFQQDQHFQQDQPFQQFQQNQKFQQNQPNQANQPNQPSEFSYPNQQYQEYQQEAAGQYQQEPPPFPAGQGGPVFRGRGQARSTPYGQPPPPPPPPPSQQTVGTWSTLG